MTFIIQSLFLSGCFAPFATRCSKNEINKNYNEYESVGDNNMRTRASLLSLLAFCTTLPWLDWRSSKRNSGHGRQASATRINRSHPGAFIVSGLGRNEIRTWHALSSVGGIQRAATCDHHHRRRYQDKT
jgi:hypothetical protein